MEIKDIESSVGRFIIEFGQIEVNIRTTIISIPRYCDSNIYSNYSKLISETLVMSESLTVNLDNLLKVVDIFVCVHCKNLWYKLVNELRIISQFRNVLVHGSWYYGNEKEIYKIKKLNFEKPILISRISLEKHISDLQIINSQFNEFNDYYLSLYQENWINFFNSNLDNKLRIK